jgi:hypothetical protein
VVTQQAARRGPPRSPLRIVAAQKSQRASARAQIIWTIPFNDCLYPHVFEQVAKFQSSIKLPTEFDPTPDSGGPRRRGRVVNAHGRLTAVFWPRQKAPAGAEALSCSLYNGKQTLRAKTDAAQ